MPSSDPFIITLAPGMGVSACFDRHALARLKEYVRDYCGGRSDGLKLTATGPVRDFTVPVDPNVPKIA
ncbi:hypothetical protein D9M70_628810 [compost metagenome]